MKTNKANKERKHRITVLKQGKGNDKVNNDDTMFEDKKSVLNQMIKHQ